MLVLISLLSVNKLEETMKYAALAAAIAAATVPEVAGFSSGAGLPLRSTQLSSAQVAFLPLASFERLQ